MIHCHCFEVFLISWFSVWSCEEDPKQYDSPDDDNVDNSQPFTEEGQTDDVVQFTFTPDDEEGVPMGVETTVTNAESVEIQDENGTVIKRVSLHPCIV